MTSALVVSYITKMCHLRCLCVTALRSRARDFYQLCYEIPNTNSGSNCRVKLSDTKSHVVNYNTEMEATLSTAIVTEQTGFGCV